MVAAYVLILSFEKMKMTFENMILSCLLKITFSTDKSWEYICPFFHQFGIGSSAAVILTDLHFVNISDKNGNNFWSSLLCCDNHHKG